MSYGQGYGQGYGGGGNPYAQAGPYRPPYNAGPPQTGGPYNQQNSAMEMTQMDGYNSYNAPSQPQDPQEILNECQRITDGVASIDRSLEQLQSVQRRALNDVDSRGPSSRELEAINSEIMSEYKSLIGRMKWIKSRPESGSPQNQKQIGRADRMLKDAFQRYRVAENDYQKRMREQMERQYRITRPDATDAEVREACEDPSQQVFSQALMRSDRRGESRQVLSAVRDRHEAIQKIEQQMTELAQLFQEMEEMVVKQEPMVQQVEQRAEETHDHMEQGIIQLGQANDRARAARKKKWICFGISVAIVIVIVIIIIIVVEVLNH